MMQIRALKLEDRDNVATLLFDASQGSLVEIIDKQSRKIQQLKIAENIPAGHKIAVVPFTPGADVVKYGNVIGKTITGIAEGEWVHVHNVESLRARGDLQEGGAEQ